MIFKITISNHNLIFQYPSKAKNIINNLCVNGLPQLDKSSDNFCVNTVHLAFKNVIYKRDTDQNLFREK